MLRAVMLLKQDSAAGRRAKEASFEANVAVIRDDMTLVGDIRSKGIVEVMGRIEGAVSCREVDIHAGAIVKGPVTAGIVQVAGRIDGPVRAPVVTILGTAHVTGTITHHTLSVAPGAVVEGRAPWRPKADWDSVFRELEET